jgi:16S rRNA (cytidine1402-2'-O)-methyltransferase
VVADIRQSDDPGTLYVVATPIGNLEDISRRALTVLSGVALIAAEDTRRTRSLLAALGLKAPKMLALHDHNEAAVSRQIVAALEAGRDTALVSDAGTPLVADPGFSLVGDCFERRLPVVPVPGASSLICALSVCPLPIADFSFLGFLPSKSAARRSRLESRLSRGPIVFFEAPHRVADCLRDLGTLVPDRRVFLGREMTKKFESYLCGGALELLETLEVAGQLRGEFVLAVEGPEGEEALQQLSVTETMRVLNRQLPPAQAARIGSELLGVPRRELYAIAQSRTGRQDAETGNDLTSEQGPKSEPEE